MELLRERLSAVSDKSVKENRDSVQRLRVAEVKRQPDEYVGAIKDVGLTVQHSAHDTVALQTLLGVPHKTVRTLRSFLQQHGINVLTSEKISRRYVTTLRHAVESGTVRWKVEEKKQEN